jgi:hypothetical protein
MYTVLSLLYIFLMLRRIEHGADELRNADILVRNAEQEAY